MGEDGFLNRAYDEGDSAQTHQLYAEWADSYDGELIDHGYATPARVAEAVKALGVDPGAKIVDLGCGTGLSGSALQAAGYTAIDGCDYSGEMLDVAEATGAYDVLDEVDLNAAPIPYGTDIYDVATIVGVFGFGHVEPGALDEAIRVVRPGGHIVIGVNEKFYAGSDLAARIDRTEASGAVADVVAELGGPIPGYGVGGGVISMQVTRETI
ncbi:MAG: methyltransferase domain-containing protein, partial [Actinomycetota bacterium]